MKAIYLIVMGIPIGFLIFRLAIYEFTRDRESLVLGRIFSALIICISSYVLFADGTSDEDKIAAFIAIVSFALAYWRSRSD